VFKKILIANRGEIACRIIASAKKLGVNTVAVFSDADKESRHVALADQAMHIGSSPASESYLVGEKIIDAALKTGAEAIHPGYGFLSENYQFVEAVQAAGLVFIGPPASAIEAMGLKDAAKDLMQKANVPVVPGYHGARQDPTFLASQAADIGYPVLIKARAGGGGKGMRLVEKPADFEQALKSAAREGQSSFGDPVVLIEKFIGKPRHIEIQIFADAHGNVVHLFERDCSLQRRHQKVIEEAPAPNMPGAVREAMCRAAIEAARAIGYQGAGTVEFIADGTGPLRTDGFWFMEMNTRLQVEHPVTEAITGLDLVALQLQVASGASLPFTQNDIAINGHSFEARLYAEDAVKGFLPASGTLENMHFPDSSNFETANVRVDSGVRENDVISPHYDPMIAKVIVHGSDRSSALRKLTRALKGCQVKGLTTNLDFLVRLSQQKEFVNGDVDTGLIARNRDALTQCNPPSDDVIAVASLAALNLINNRPAGFGFRAWGSANAYCNLIFNDKVYTSTIAIKGAGHFLVNGISMNVSGHTDELTVTSNGQTRKYTVQSTATEVSVFNDGEAIVFEIHDPMRIDAEQASNKNTVLSPMPGLIIDIKTRAGDKVSQGDLLITLEAMKMEHTLKAPRDGIIEELFVAKGDQVEDGLTLLKLMSNDG